MAEYDNCVFQNKTLRYNPYIYKIIFMYSLMNNKQSFIYFLVILYTLSGMFTTNAQFTYFNNRYNNDN